MFQKIAKVVVAVLIASFLSLSLYALTNEEKLEILEEKLLKGEIDQDLYRELRKKYEGGAAGVSKTQVKQKPGILIIHDGDSLKGIEPDFGKSSGCKCQVAASVDTEDKLSGKGSIKLEVTVPAKWADFLYTFENINIKDKDAKIKLWFKGDPKAYIRPSCDLWDAEGKMFTLPDVFGNLGRNREWKCFTIPISSAKPRQAGSQAQIKYPIKMLRLDVYNKFPGTFVFHFDDITVEKEGQVAEVPKDQTVLQDRATNLATNGQCEKDSDGNGIPDGWHTGKEGKKYLSQIKPGVSFFASKDEAGKYSYLSDYGFKSKHSVQMSVKGADKWAEWDVEAKGIKKNTKYVLAFWYCSPARGGTLSAACFGSLHKIERVRHFKQWMCYAINLNSGSFSGNTTIGFVLNGYQDEELTAGIDHVQLYEGEVPRGAEKALDKPSFFTGENEAVLDYYTYDTVYVSPQIASNLDMGLRYRFKDKSKRPKELRIHLDLPEGVKVKKCYANYWSTSPKTRRETSEVEHNGKKYTRNTFIWEIPQPGARFSEQWLYSNMAHPGRKSIHWYLETTLQPGEERSLYYSLDWDSGNLGKLSQEKRQLSVECIDIPKAPHIDGFILCERIGLLDMHNWPEFFKLLKFLGVNWITIDERALKEYSAEQLRKMGFEPTASQHFCHNSAYSQAGSRSNWKDEVVPLGVDGKNNPRASMPCLAKRGNAYRQTVAIYRKWIDQGIYTFMLDDEGKTECYCEDCTSGFKRYLKTVGETAPYENPRTFMAKNKPDSIMHQRWYEYGRWQYGNIVCNARKELEQYLKSKSIDPQRLVFYNEGIPLGMDAKDRYRNNLGMKPPKELYACYAQAFPYYGDQIYINCYDWGMRYYGLPSIGGDKQEYNSREYGSCGVKQMPIPGAELTYMHPMNDYQPHKVLKYLLMELAVAGVHGWHIFPFSDLDLRDMFWMNQVRVEMKKAEEIFMKGKPIRRFNEWGIMLDGFKQVGIYMLEDKKKFNWQSVRGLKYRDEAVILVADYSTMENVPTTIEFEYEVKKISNLIDLQTGKKVGALTPGKPRYKVKLGEERARWFYVGPKEKLE